MEGILQIQVDFLVQGEIGSVGVVTALIGQQGLVFLKNLRAGGTTIVLVTHNMDEAAKNADRICCLGRGEILTVTTPEELFSDYDHCRQLGIDIPEITSFSHKIIDNLKVELPDFHMDGISFASDRLSKQIFNAAVDCGGGLS